MSVAGIAVEPVELRAADGYRLGAFRYRGPDAPHAQIIIAGATAVPQRFYRRFAEFAAGRGYDVLTLDYRGVGESRPADLRGFQIDYLDWARQDLAAAVDHHAREDRPLFVVGHSYGGHAIGLLPNHDRIRQVQTFGSGAGWHGWMPPKERLRVWFFWNVLGPLFTTGRGYFPGRRLGVGEDLPIGVYRQWRRWCRYPNYFFGDPDYGHLAEQFARVRLRIVALTALDDEWAMPASRDAFMAGYVNAPWQGIDLDPADYGLERIGHMGYFHASAQQLWAQTLERFESELAVPA